MNANTDNGTRQVVLDTETTGLEADMGHRIIEIGAVELINRRLTGRHFHKYINPHRAIDDGALEVHGITEAFLADKPDFEVIWPEFHDFIEGSELVIHNAPFDVSFINYEMRKLDPAADLVDKLCAITDSLALARYKHPGQKNSLDALCRRYAVDNSQRQLHGALLDAEILADVYLLMTGGQTQLFATSEQTSGSADEIADSDELSLAELNLRVIKASADDLSEHESYLEFLADRLPGDGRQALWRELH